MSSFAGYEFRVLRSLGHSRFIAPLRLLFCLLILLCAVERAPAAELVNNGLFTAGIGAEPAAWGHEAYFSDSSSVSFDWYTDSAGAGVIKISNLKPDDSRYYQAVTVSPSTWYHVSGWMRTEGVGTTGGGASIVDLVSNFGLPDQRGTHAWQHIDFWMHTAVDQGIIRLACRVGGYAALNTGTAYFTAISVVEGNGPPTDEKNAFGGSAPRSVSSLFSWGELVIALILGIGILLLLWRFVASETRRVPP